MNELILKTSGKDYEVTLYENRIEYKRKGLSGLLMHGADGTKIISLKAITGIQFLKNVYIQFIFQGSQESKKGFWAANFDENTIIFDKKYNDDFEKIKDYITARM